MDIFDAESMLVEFDRESRRMEKAIWGRRQKLPADEFEIAFNFNLSDEEKLAKLAVVRKARAARNAARKARKPQPKPKAVVLEFPDLLNSADIYRAKGLGVRL